MIVLPSVEEIVLVAYRENGDIRNTCKIVFLSCIVMQCSMIKICVFVKLGSFQLCLNQQAIIFLMLANMRQTH